MPNRNLIIAIDPGNEQSAMVWLKDGEIARHEILDNEGLVQSLLYIGDTKETDVVIEMVASYGMPVGKTIFSTCVWIGRFIQACPLTVNLVYRKDIKLHLCNSMRAKDSHVRQALIDRFGEPGTKKNPGLTYGVHKDEWSALAVAVYWRDQK